MTTSDAGRICPLRYRYPAAALATAPSIETASLYVVGGLYGNGPCLDEVEVMAQAEAQPPTLCFNGDFNWFDIEDRVFDDINRRVLSHHAILGNVEAEFDADTDEAGCGCAYPPRVDEAIVERSNEIHRRLKATARRHPVWCDALLKLPMFARYQVGSCRIAVVHGDAESLAGWRFDVSALDDSHSQASIRSSFAQSQVDLFASSHTCLPAMRRFELAAGRAGWIVNNGAAGMPNFAGTRFGLCTRVALDPSPHPVLQEVRIGETYVALLPICFDHERWCAEFLAQWPPGSAAWCSYFERISHGPAFSVAQALAPSAHR